MPDHDLIAQGWIATLWIDRLNQIETDDARDLYL